MTTRATKPCDKGCNGTGRVKRDVRKLASGLGDPLDFRREELCPACGGGGRVTDWGGKPVPTAHDRKPGFVADDIHGSFRDTLINEFAAGAYC